MLKMVNKIFCVVLLSALLPTLAYGMDQKDQKENSNKSEAKNSATKAPEKFVVKIYCEDDSLTVEQREAKKIAAADLTEQRCFEFSVGACVQWNQAQREAGAAQIEFTRKQFVDSLKLFPKEIVKNDYVRRYDAFLQRTTTVYPPTFFSSFIRRVKACQDQETLMASRRPVKAKRIAAKK